MTADKHISSIGFQEESSYGFDDYDSLASVYKFYKTTSSFRFKPEPITFDFHLACHSSYCAMLSETCPFKTKGTYPFPIFETKLIDGEYVVEELS